MQLPALTRCGTISRAGSDLQARAPRRCLHDPCDRTREPLVVRKRRGYTSCLTSIAEHRRADGGTGGAWTCRVRVRGRCPNLRRRFGPRRWTRKRGSPDHGDAIATPRVGWRVRRLAAASGRRAASCRRVDPIAAAAPTNHETPLRSTVHEHDRRKPAPPRSAPRSGCRAASAARAARRSPTAPPACRLCSYPSPRENCRRRPGTHHRQERSLPPLSLRY